MGFGIDCLLAVDAAIAGKHAEGPDDERTNGGENAPDSCGRDAEHHLAPVVRSPTSVRFCRAMNFAAMLTMLSPVSRGAVQVGGMY